MTEAAFRRATATAIMICEVGQHLPFDFFVVNKMKADNSVADLSRAMKLKPKSIYAHNNRAFVYQKAGDYGRALLKKYAFRLWNWKIGLTIIVITSIV